MESCVGSSLFRGGQKFKALRAEETGLNKQKKNECAKFHGCGMGLVDLKEDREGGLI